MDKNLKKLNRAELLDLMVGLAEDYEELADGYEALARENERLKKELSTRRLPRSAKVGSIAEAALQANGYFEAAQRSADEYLREIKRLRDELTKRSDARELNRELADNVAAARQAENRAQAQLRDAQVQARQIVARANSKAEAIVANAQRRADEVLANANRQAHVAASRGSLQSAATGELAARRGRHARATAEGRS